MNPFASILRRVRFRGLKEGQVQKARVEALDTHARDDAERWQDYGFSSNAVDGEGLALEIDGHTILIRADRLAERPALENLEVRIWHKEGHYAALKTGKKIEVVCDDLTATCKTATITASEKVTAATPLFETTGNVKVGGNLEVAGKLTNQGKDVGKS